MFAFSRLGKLGRLGNQLFQVAATVAAAEQYSERARFPEWTYAKYFVGPFDQDLSDDDIEQTYFELTSEYNAIPKLEKADLFGFFQSEQYFREQQEVIRRKFSFVDGVLAPHWQSFEADCAIHVRRGDYLQESHRFVPLQLDYYERALQLARERGCKTFVVCSDDPQWCKEHFPADVVIAEDLDDIQSLCLMSRCKNHIIANSTLSWWSSWLCSNPAKFILAPQIWYGFRVSFRKDDAYQYCLNWDLIPHTVSLTKQVISLCRTDQPELFFLPFIDRRRWLLAEERSLTRRSLLQSAG